MDMFAKGRRVYARGELHQKAKLNTKTVIAVRNMAATGANYSEISQAHGISNNHARQIVIRNCWKHIQ